MEIISYIEGASRFAFNWDNVRPKEGVPVALFIDYVKDIYHFEECGLSPNAAQLGIQAPFFRRGAFLHNEKPRGITALEVTPDGLMATSTKTEFAEDFVLDLFRKLSEGFAYRTPKLDEVTYQSSIVTDFGFDISSTLTPWHSVVTRANELRGSHRPRYEPVSLRCMVPDSADLNIDTKMVFEKRFPSPKDQFYFYSLVPLSTPKHEELLKHIDKTFGKKRK